MTLRIFIAVTHLLGAGHLTRAAALARAFAAGRTRDDIGLRWHALARWLPARASNSCNSRRYGRPEATSERFSTKPVMRSRRSGSPGAGRMLLEAFRAAKPDVVITELFPFGRRVLAEEFIGASGGSAPTQAAPPRRLIGTRHPCRARKARARRRDTRAIVDLLRRGARPRATPVSRRSSSPGPWMTAIEPMIRYTGYVDEGPPSAKHERPRSGVVVSGGSSAASLPLYRAALKAARLASGMRWRILVGAGVDERSFETLRATAPAKCQCRARPAPIFGCSSPGLRSR